MDHRTSKLIARRLVALPAGTVSFESMGHERLLGKVDSEPCLVRQFSRGPRTRVSEWEGREKWAHWARFLEAIHFLEVTNVL